MATPPSEENLDLKVEPTESADCEGQRCRLGTELCTALGVELGSFVRVTTSNVSATCSVWPRPDGQDGVLQFSELVTRDSYSTAKVSEGVPHIDVLTSANAKSVELSVIASDIDSFEKLKHLHRDTLHLQDYCRNCLHYVGVSVNVKVNLHKSRIGKKYGMAYLHIHAIKPEMVDVVVVSKSTKVRVRDIITDEKYRQRLKKSNLLIGGLEEPAASLKEVLRLPMILKDNPGFRGAQLPRGVLLHGPPGCGKTTLVQYVAAECDAQLITVNGPELLASQPGESEENLRKVFNMAMRIGKTDGCVLFFDEIDTLCPRNDSKSSDTNKNKMTSQLGLLMDGIEADSGLVVVAATNRPSAIDPSIRRPGRFDREVLLSIPTMKQREKILTVHMNKMPIASDVNISELAEQTTGYSGADLLSVCQEAAYVAISESQHTSEKMTPVPMNRSHFKTALRKTMPSLTKGMETVIDAKPMIWDDIGGLEDVKREIQQTIEWPLKYAEKFQKLKLNYPHGVLLYGPPGCCKTTLVTTAAMATNTVFLSLSSASLYSPYVGHSETLLSELFTRARACAPAIIFLDEVDACFGKRSEGGTSHGSGVKDRLLSTLLNQMDGIGVKLDDKIDAAVTKKTPPKDTAASTSAAGETQNPPETTSTNKPFVIVVAATNRPEMVDEALLRPGRFDRIIYVPPPDELTRLEILQVYTRKMQLNKVDLEILAKQTINYTGADLSNLCQEAALLALSKDGLSAQKVSMENFQKALSLRGPSLSEQLIRQYEEMKAKFCRITKHK